MSDFDMDDIVLNIRNTLAILADRIAPPDKNPLIVPSIGLNSDDAEKRRALREMLENLSSSKRADMLSDDDIKRASDFFSILYGGEGGYRHKYADICDLVFNAFDASGDELDNGIPYSVNCLADNINTIHEHMVESGRDEQAKSVYKLADHIDLEKTRLRHYIEQQNTLKAIRTERDEAEKKRTELEEEFDERLDKTRMEYIAILGVFSAVVLAFNGGVSFSTASITALGTAGGIRSLIFIVALVGLVLIDAISILLVFLWKMSFNHRVVELGKWPRNCLIAANVVLVVIMLSTSVVGHPYVRSLLGLS